MNTLRQAIDNWHAGGSKEPCETVVYAPGGLGSCAVLVERAATVLLELLAEDERGV